MILSAVSVLVVAQSSSEIPEGLMNNPVVVAEKCWRKGTEMKALPTVPLLKIICTTSTLDGMRTDGKKL